jgi:hypothetical protein
VPDLRAAAPCAIPPRSYLVCDNRTMGSTPRRRYDAPAGFPSVAPIEPAGDPNAVIDHYSVGEEDNAFRWRSGMFGMLNESCTLR